MLYHADLVEVSEQAGVMVVIIDHQLVVVPGVAPPALRMHVFLRLPVFYVGEGGVVRILEPIMGSGRGRSRSQDRLTPELRRLRRCRV